MHRRQLEVLSGSLAVGCDENINIYHYEVGLSTARSFGATHRVTEVPRGAPDFSSCRNDFMHVRCICLSLAEVVRS